MAFNEYLGHATTVIATRFLGRACMTGPKIFASDPGTDSYNSLIARVTAISGTWVGSIEPSLYTLIKKDRFCLCSSACDMVSVPV